VEILGRIAGGIDRFNRSVGECVAWLALFMVLVQFAVVLTRYIFGYGSIFMQESIIYMHGLLFLLGAGYTLLQNGHVRVDIFYRAATPRRKAMVDLFGVLFLLGPVCIAMALFSWPYVMNAWRILESSKETSGIPAVFLLKSAILAFLLLLLLQGVSMALHALRRLAGCPDAAVPGGEDGLREGA